MSGSQVGFPPPQGIVPGGIPFPSWACWPPRPPRYIGDHEQRRVLRTRVDGLLSGDGTWGFAIVRTCFGDDALFANAIRVLHGLVDYCVEADLERQQKVMGKAMSRPENFQYAPVSVDTEPNAQFRFRFRLDLLEDRALQDATVEQVRHYFNEWLRFVDRPYHVNDGDTRYRACIMMDRETMEMMANLPQGFPRPRLTYYRNNYCVKMVEAVDPRREAFLVHIFGEDDVIKYWFDRMALQKRITDITDYADEGGKKVLYYGAEWKTHPERGVTFAPPPPTV